MTDPEVHLVLSEDELLADEFVEGLRAKLPPGAEVLTLAAEGGDVPGIEEALFAQSLFASDRFVVVRDAERLQAAGLKRLGEAARRGGLAATVAIVAVSDRPLPSLSRALQGAAKAHRIGRPKRGELIAWVVRRMKGAGVAPGRDAAALLVEAVGTNLRDLSHAIGQLATRLGAGGTVEGADVAAQFQRVAEQPVWALFDALGAGDGRKAFRVLHALFDAGEDPIAILFALASQLRYVMRARSAIERSPSLTDQQLAQALAVTPGRAAVLKRQAGKLGWDWLLRVHRACAEADFDLKGGDEVRIVGVLPPEIVLERLCEAALPATEAVPG